MDSMENIKIVATLVASCIAVMAYIPYIRDIRRGTCKPHLYTWISWFLITATVSVILLLGGAGLGAIPTLVGSVVNAIILYLAFSYGTKDVVLLDKVCLIIAIIGTGMYIVFHEQALLALWTIMVADLISFVPTFRKTHRAPYSESLPSYYLTILKAILVLVALETYTLLTTSYYVVWIIVISAFLICVSIWRSQDHIHHSA